MCTFPNPHSNRSLATEIEALVKTEDIVGLDAAPYIRHHSQWAIMGGAHTMSDMHVDAKGYTAIRIRNTTTPTADGTIQRPLKFWTVGLPRRDVKPSGKRDIHSRHYLRHFNADKANVETLRLETVPLEANQWL